MAEIGQRTFLRDVNGPIVVDARHASPKNSSTSRRSHRSGDNGRDYSDTTNPRRQTQPSTPSRRDPERRDRHKKPSHRRRDSKTEPVGPPILNMTTDNASFIMDIIEPPPRTIVLGTPIDTSTMISVRLPSSDQRPSANSIDTSRFLAVASLVTDTRSGESISIEAGMLTGQKMFDSVHAIPADCASSLARSQPCKLALGYFSFPGLLIRQAGSYRIRVTLIKMGVPGTGGGSSLLTVDSEPIRVERSARQAVRRTCS